jgi:hypothetical protein
VNRHAVAALALSGLAAGCASPGRTDVVTATALARPGWCHRLADPAELYAPSDVAPPVPCWTPHQSETLATVRLPMALALLPGPPDQVGGLANTVCRGPVDRTLRAFLGADDLDRHWGIDVWLKVPTRREWAGGVRVGRCDLVLGGRPTLTHGLRGALRWAGSAAIRRCRFGTRSLTCDRPHTSEEVGGWTGIVGAVYPGTAEAARLVSDQCWRNAERYSGGAIDRLPVRPVAGPLTAADWRQGRRTTDCWIVQDDGRPTRGTLRADLTVPAPGGRTR